MPDAKQGADRTKVLSVRLTTEEFEALSARATEVGVGPSTLARTLVRQGLARPTPDTPDTTGARDLPGHRPRPHHPPRSRPDSSPTSRLGSRRSNGGRPSTEPARVRERTAYASGWTAPAMSLTPTDALPSGGERSRQRPGH